MPFEQTRIRYYSKSETANAIGVSRQTLITGFKIAKFLLHALSAREMEVCFTPNTNFS